MFRSKSRVLAALALALGVRTIGAQQSAAPAITLGELSVLKVLTASKSLESASEAPGIVTTITAEEIRAYGASNLLQVLERLPGTYALTNTTFPSGVVTVRGIEMPEVSSRVLVLLNGRPVRESTHGAMNMAIFTAFPIETIDRIEMVRGPGSVLYGTNAFAGVVNIIMKDAITMPRDVRATYGSFDALSVGANGGFERGDLSITTGVQYARERDALSADHAFNLGENLTGASILGRYKRLTFTAFGGGNALSRHGSTDNIVTRHATADLGWEQSIMSSWDASLNATYNYTHNKFLADEKARDYVVEVTNHVRLPHETRLVFGGLAYTLGGRGSRGTREHLAPYSETRWSGYAQLDVHVDERLKLIGGGQVNKVEGRELDFVPRLGAIFNATSSLGAKLLYGQAFRSPFAVELSINVPNIIRGNAELKPEKIGTFDAQAFYNGPHVQLAVTYFNSHMKDLVVLLPNGAGRQFLNHGKSSIQGLEIESKVKPTEQLDLQASYVYQIAEDADSRRMQTMLPTTMAKIGASYVTKHGITLGVFDTYFNSPYFTFNPGMTVDATHYMTANVRLDLTKLLARQQGPGMELELGSTNLLGEVIHTPMSNTRGVAYPRTSGRALTAGLRMTF
jgi:outer membrane receptor for ferrienterochelin and colicins